MINTNIGKPQASKIAQVANETAAMLANSQAIEFYTHYVNLKCSAEWLDQNSHRDLASIFRNFAEEIFSNSVGDKLMENQIFNREKGFVIVDEKSSKSEIVRRILRRNIFETRHLIKKIRNKFRNIKANEQAKRRIEKILRIYEQQLFWLKIFLKHRSEGLV